MGFLGSQGSSALQAVGPVAVTSLLLGSGIPGIIDAPVQFDPNNPHNRHAQDVYNHAAIQVPTPSTPVTYLPSGTS